MSAIDSPDSRLHAFGMHLRRLRESRGLSIEELAARSRLSTRGLVYIEHGKRNPSLLTLLQLAEGLKTAPVVLLEEFPEQPGQPHREAD